MPLLSELGWILELLKLVGRFIPADRFASPDRQLPPPPEILELDAELREQAAALRARIEAPLHDLRKQAQEQNLKLHQMQEEIHGLQQGLDATLKLSHEIKNEMATLRLWLAVVSGGMVVSLLLLVMLLLRH